LTLAVPWEVKGRFTASGFEGHLQGLDASACEDPVLVSAALPNMAIKVDPQSGKVRCGPEQVLLPDQFFDQALISDLQRDRQTLLRELMKADRTLIPRHPSLLVWTRPLEGPVSFPDEFVRRGWTLGFCPIRLESLEPGTPFLLPAGFVRLESYIGARGLSTVFNSETGRWLDAMDKPSESELRCRLPNAVLPCDLQRCNVEMWVSAPGRTVEIKGRIDGQFQTVHRIDNPAGRVTFTIEDPRVLSLDQKGGFLISIAVSETEQERQRRNQPVPAENDATADASTGPLEDTNSITWAIRYVHLNLEGTAK
jgi:hypothetical protein